MTELKINSCCEVTAVENVRIIINESTCTGCGTCGEVCPFGLPKCKDNGKYEILNPSLCTECSACQRNCPVGAIKLREVKGCGCLWDARKRIKNKNNSCCG
jgi:ferredoxin